MRMRSTTLEAIQLGILFGTVRWKAWESSYEDWRARMTAHLKELHAEDVVLPDGHAEFVEKWGELSDQIFEKLKDLRHRLGGSSDVFALPFFYIAVETQTCLASWALEDDYKENYDFVAALLDDLGVERTLLNLLEIEAGLLKATAKGVSTLELAQATVRFINRVVEAAAKVTPTVDDELQQDDQQDRDAEEAYYRRLSTVVNKLVSEGAIEATRQRLTGSLGLTAEAAEALTISDPIQFAERWLRWMSGQPTTQTDEKPLWSAFNQIDKGGATPSIIRPTVPLLSTDQIRSLSHTVIMIHGIRASAKWSDLVRRHLKEIPNLRVAAIEYGYVDVVRFWLPWRAGLVSNIRRRINDRHAEALEDAEKRGESDCLVSVIAHSFGSYALTRAIEDNLQLRLHHVVLCGAIVPHSFRWEAYTRNISGKVVNERGARDVWPAMAQAMSWGYGATGTFGASQSRVEDRLHDLDHGGFFTDDFVERFWVPLFRDGEIAEPAEHGRQPSWWLGAVASLPLQWALAACLLAGLVAAGIWATSVLNHGAVAGL